MRTVPERRIVADFLVHNIGELLTCDGSKDNRLGILRDATVRIKDGKIAHVGRDDTGSHDALTPDTIVIDAEGALCTPGLVDPHTHPIFAGSRAEEFDLRVRGATYQEIQSRGGGILSTVKATNSADDDELVQSTAARFERFLRNGVTLAEAKTGYALTIDGELRLLKLLERARAQTAVDISPTLLAHVPPPDQDRKQYVARFIEELIPAVAHEQLAEAVDVYCDAGAFTLDETRAILSAAKAHGRMLRVHAEQFTRTGAAELAAEIGAASVEHLEELGPGVEKLLARAGTVCNLLPGAALTLKLKWPDARRMLDAGCRVALGTDCNPGSSLTESLPLMMSLAAMQMGMSCEEVWLAVTRQAAHALGRSDAGRISAGARGDLVLWDASDHREVVQHFGVPLVRTVIVGGELAFPKE